MPHEGVRRHRQRNPGVRIDAPPYEPGPSGSRNVGFVLGAIHRQPRHCHMPWNVAPRTARPQVSRRSPLRCLSARRRPGRRCLVLLLERGLLVRLLRHNRSFDTDAQVLPSASRPRFLAAGQLRR
jgi:hypothetical protein